MPLTPPTAIVAVSDTDFDREVLASPVPTLVDFWASWCGPCHWVAPQLERIAATDDRVRIAKLNVDENRATASRFGVMSIPTLALFVGGVERTRIVGAADSGTIMAEVEPHLPQ
ncbi:MAG: thioredoxin [Acidimicrobiales bacterium]|nr:thioredoxin [Actinomycetota bacterium]